VSIQINIGDHVSPLEPLFQPVPFRHQWVTNWARARAKLIAVNLPSANDYFRSLPRGRSLTQILADRTIWISFAPDIDAMGGTDPNGLKEIGIAPIAYQWGRWTVLGTLVHELAHTNGAPGGASRAAEEALIHCGLGKHSERSSGVDDPKTPFAPWIEG
jgi:hypothetical protein